MALAIEFPQVVWSIEFGGDETVVRQVTMTGGGGAVDSVNGQTGVVVLDAGDVGADPAGTAAGLVDDLSGVTNAATARTNLGLGNVDNTSDANKPVSSAQQTALDGKAAASHSHSGADITSGTVATARLGSGTANATTFLRGDQTWAAVTPGASALNDLTDVDTATDPPATDDVLAWDGTLWTPAALTAADTGAIPESLLDAKGDLIVATAADTAARLAVGSDGQVLTADAASSGGVKWAAPSGASSDWHTISDEVLASAGTFTFPSLSGLTDIEIELRGRSTYSGAATDGVRMTLNGNTSADYSIHSGARTTSFNNNGSLPSSLTNTDRVGLWVAKFALGGVGMMTEGWVENTYVTSTATTGVAYSVWSLHYWNTSAAITSFSMFFTSAANFAAGSRLTLRGRTAP